MELSVLDAAEVRGLEPLLAAHPYNDYRNYRGLSQEARVQILLSEIQRAGQQGHPLALKDTDQIVGVATLSPLPWDSEIFRLPMAKIAHLVAARREGARGPLLDRLLNGVVELARTQGMKHLSTRVDCADVEAIHSLERGGFRLMECLVTYLFRPRKDAIPPIKTLYKIRPYRPEDRDALLAIVEGMFASYQSRFATDPDLPADGARRFYIAWTKNACSGEMADYLFVAERRERPVAFLAYRLNAHILKCTGARIVGQSLSASLPEGTGSYVGLCKAALEVGVAEHDFVEADAPLHHFVVIRAWQRLGFQPVRAKYAFHRGLV